MEVCKLLGINHVSHSSKSEIRSYKFFKIKLTIHLFLSSCLSVDGIISYNAYNVNRFYLLNMIFIKNINRPYHTCNMRRSVFLRITKACRESVNPTADRLSYMAAALMTAVIIFRSCRM